MLCCLIVNGQIRLRYNETGLQPTQLQLEAVSDSIIAFTNVGLQQMLQQAWQPVSNDLPEISYSAHATWIRVPLAAIRKQGSIDWMDIQNPHINKLGVWIVSKNSVLKAYRQTGDAFPFFSRALPSRSFLYPLHDIADSSASIIIAVDKRKSKLEVPVQFMSNDYLIRHFDIDTKGLMFFLGFSFFLFLFNAYLFVSSREAAFGWYLAYLALVCLYVCTDTGLMFKLFYPGFPAVNDIIRPASFALSIAPMMLFFNSILDVRQQHPGIYKINRILFWLYIVLFVMAVSSSAISNDADLQRNWVNANRVVTPMVLVILFLESVYFLRRGQLIALFSLGSFTSLIVCSMLYVGLQTGFLPANLLTSYSLYWGLAADAVFMGLSLAWRFRLFRITMDRLLQEKAARQEQINVEISNWQEQQLQQFSSLLHDHIGGLIGVLRLSVDNMELTENGRKKLSDEIVLLAEEIRQNSHTFSPTPLKTFGLKNSIETMIQKVRDQSAVQFQFEWMGEAALNSPNLDIIIYQFSQEVVHNILKHAKCTEAIFQIINHPHLISLYIEDNGIGCNNALHQQGIGLQSIKRITELMGGQLHITSQPREGFSLSIEIPY